MKNSNIVLIGFMGVGKGRVARELAAQTGQFAIDTDDLIESFCNLKIRKIFRIYGEAYFRKIERKVAFWMEQKVKDTIVSTGGGFFAVENLNAIGTVIYLYSDFDTIIQEIMNHPKAEKKLKKRPLLRDIEKARDLFDERDPLYRKKAEIIIDVRNRESAATAREILSRLSLPAGASQA